MPTPALEADGGRDAAGLGLCLVYSECAGVPAACLLRRGEEVGIGRHPDNRIVLADDVAASRNHALLFWQADGLHVRDLGSTNGTWVNGERVALAPLRNQTSLRVGGSVFCVTSAEYARQVAPWSPLVPLEAADVSGLVGGTWLRDMREQLARIARTDLSVVVQGESGTGKEPVARELHRLSGRSGRFVPVNCTALPAALIESELFGYKRGAFSGASAGKPGLVRAANGGTLFLDEIGDMPLEAQAKLLRVLQEREVLPLGATQPEAVDLRVICATHRDLEQAVVSGTFRGDLMARVRQFSIKLPPLRERRSDLLPLVLHFLSELGRSDLRPSSGLMQALACHAFPYNVRELKSAIQVAATLATGPLLLASHLPESVRAGAGQGSAAASKPAPPELAQTRQLKHGSLPPPDEPTLRALLQKHAGNISAVSRELKKDRVQIHRWLRRYGIASGEGR